MSIKISPASPQDAEDLARLVILGNADDAMSTLVVSPERNATPAQKAEQLRWRTERNRSNMQRAGAHWFKAVDTLTGGSVGFAGVVASQSEKSGWDGKLSETMDEKWFKIYMGAIGEKKESLLGGREDVWYMPAMIVHPDCQRRGIGSRLLAEVCSLTDEVGQDVYLESSPRGTKLYLNAGFDKIDSINLLDGAYVLGCMLREARPKE